MKVVEEGASLWDTKQIHIDDRFVTFAGLQGAENALSATLSPPNMSESKKVVVDDKLEITFHRTL